MALAKAFGARVHVVLNPQVFYCLTLPPSSFFHRRTCLSLGHSVARRLCWDQCGTLR